MISKNIHLVSSKLRMGDNNIQELATITRKRLSNMSLPDPECCIYRVHYKLRKEHESAYTPKMVSIGPFHRNKEAFRAMEDRKWCFLHSFLERNPDLKLEGYLKVLQGLEEKTRRCYNKQMMLLDGCFIIELLVQFNTEDAPRFGYDPIFNEAGFLSTLRSDMILLENQIPFFVLQCLFNITTVFNAGPSLIELVLNFFKNIIPRNKIVPIVSDGVEIRHLLDLLRYSYAPTITEMQQEYDSLERPPYSAGELRAKAGVKFKKGNAGSLLDIKFTFDAMLEIPPLKIVVETESLFRNLIAFEQCCGGWNTYITDYISFMGNLIKSWNDA